MPGREIGDKRDVCLLAGATAVAAAFGISFAIGVPFFFFFSSPPSRVVFEERVGDRDRGRADFKGVIVISSLLKVKFVI